MDERVLFEFGDVRDDDVVRFRVRERADIKRRSSAAHSCMIAGWAAGFPFGKV